MSQADVIGRVVASLNEATLNDAHWPAACALLEEACGATSSELVVGEGFGDDVRIYFAEFYRRGRRRRHLEEEYFALYHPQDERLPRLRRLPDSQIVHVRDLFTQKEIKTSPTYNEALAKSGNQGALNVRLDGPDGLRIVWVIGGPADPRGWGARQFETIQSLLPHVRQFVRVRQALSAVDALGASLTGLLDNTGVGVIQLDHQGRIVETNDRARYIFLQGDGLRDQDGFLLAASPLDNARLERLLSHALPTFRRESASGSMAIRRSSRQSRLVLHVNPVGHRLIDFDSQRVAALVLVEEPGASPPAMDPQLVAQALGLTLAESLVAVELAEGRSVREISAARGRSQDTTRWHLKQTYRKLGIARQADLVRLVLSTALISSPTEREKDHDTHRSP